MRSSGPKGRHDPDRIAVRHGHEAGERDARRSARRRFSGRGCGPPTAARRCRLQTYAHFADRDPLTGVVLERMLAGVSHAPLRAHAEPVGDDVERGVAVDIEVRGLARRSSRARASASVS